MDTPRLNGQLYTSEKLRVWCRRFYYNTKYVFNKIMTENVYK